MRILGGVSSFPSRCGTQLKHCSRGCTRWTGDLHLGLHPDFVRPFHIPTDPTWPHPMRAQSPWQKTDLRKKILYGKTAKAAHLHQKKVPKRTFLANLAVRVSKNHTKPDRPTRHASPSTTTKPPLWPTAPAPGPAHPTTVFQAHSRPFCTRCTTQIVRSRTRPTIQILFSRATSMVQRCNHLYSIDERALIRMICGSCRASSSSW